MNVLKLKSLVCDHCGGNPFQINMPLMNIVTSVAVPDKAGKDILLRDEKGLRVFKDFVSDRLVKGK